MANKQQSMSKRFVWQGVTQKRAIANGELEAPTLVKARSILRQEGIRVTKLRRKPRPLLERGKRVNPIDVSFLSRQMATMISAGIPIAQTLRAIGTGHDNSAIEKLMIKLSLEVESGTALSVALSKHPQHFNQLFTSLIKAGEESGKLDIMLERVASHNEKVQTIKSKVKSAMIYPIIVLIISIAVTLLMLLFVIPQFEALFLGVGADLPVLTRSLIILADWAQAHWYLALTGIIIMLAGFKYLHAKSPKIQYSIDRVLLKVPTLGSILKKSALARYSRTMAISFNAGVPLVDGMNTVGASTGNQVFQRAALQVKTEISNGHSLQQAMTMTKLFPNLMLQMVSTGEESGELEIMLDKLAEFYEREVDDAVDSITSVIEPAMIVILGVVIGTMVLAMYLPVFKMASAY